jgi:5-methylcytosine-specific restriction enzyme A
VSRREFPKIVKRDAFMRANGCCEGTKPDGERCQSVLTLGKYHYDHDIADGLGGEPVLENCVVLCIACHKEKTTKRDIPAIAKTKRIQDDRMGIRKPSRLKSAPFHKSAPQRTASRPLVRRAHTQF